MLSVCLHTSSCLGLATCSVLELTVSYTILLDLGTFAPKFYIFNPFINLLSLVRDANIFISVFIAFDECSVL